MNPTTSDFEIGYLYRFTDNREKCLWGIFSHRDSAERIVLEVCSSDFQLFELNSPLPGDFTHAEIAPHADLRDFAYNMGSQGI